MSREWKPGDVAMIEVGCHANRNVGIRAGDGWYYGDNRWARHDPAIITARPLVVIDPDDREAVERLWSAASTTPADLASELRDMANPKPPKPEDPCLVGSVAEEHGQIWVRLDTDEAGWYPSDRAGEARCWYDFTPAVRVLSPGVEVDQ